MVINDIRTREHENMLLFLEQFCPPLLPLGPKTPKTNENNCVHVWVIFANVGSDEVYSWAGALAQTQIDSE